MATLSKSGIKAIDLFCGVGGLTYGLQQAGIKVVAGIDNDASCKYAFEENNNSTFLSKDIKELTTEELNALWGNAKIRILAGCAPCQTFSQHTNKVKGREKDERWRLLYSFLKIIERTKPDVVTMENVPQLRKFHVFEDFVKGLGKMDYYVSYKIVHCPKYGIPQNRKRLVLLASRFGKIDLIPETHDSSRYKTVRDIIGKTNSSKDPLYKFQKLTPLNIKRIKQSKQGGTWLDWDKNLRLKCHKKATGISYRAVYGRMRWNAPAPTMTTQFYNYGTGRFGHPTKNRALTLREGALIQTFPKTYKFVKKGENVLFQAVGRHIGNAVPVKLGEVIGKSIMEHIRNNARKSRKNI